MYSDYRLSWSGKLRHQRVVRLVHLVLAPLAVSACATSFALAGGNPSDTAPSFSCAARDITAGIEWHRSDETDAAELSRWCRAVGAPVVAHAPAPIAPPRLHDLVVVSWNAHLAEGELDELIEDLREGKLTGGRPVEHFVLLIQELFRRGDAVPHFNARDRSAFAIHPRDADAADIDDYAASLGLSVIYVPSMRNGPDLREDRGNAIISTEPLHDPYAVELPLARQRRVALGAAIDVATDDGTQRLEVLNAHLEPLSSPRTLWVFKNPRTAQVRAILEVLDQPRFRQAAAAGVVMGGDFNTVRDGDREHAYHLARTWSSSLREEDARDTHMMGRLDYVFANLRDGWTLSTTRANHRFGSDHYPVIGLFSR